MRRLLLPALLAAATVGASAAPTLANTTVSSNWSGYAVHRTGVRFRSATGRWRVPRPDCAQTPGSASAMWAGIGGYATNATGLEQVGTETDCSVSGRAVSSAWSEVLPAASQTLALAVHPGDLMEATVDVAGHRVRMTLADLTTHRTAARSLTSATIDTTSAEWILEAPSECTNSERCVTLPLAHFVHAGFGRAAATTVRGFHGTVRNRLWGTTEILLAAGGRRFVADAAGASSGGGAIPSGLSATGAAFSIAYTATRSPQGSAAVARLTPRAWGDRQAVASGVTVNRPWRMPTAFK